MIWLTEYYNDLWEKSRIELKQFLVSVDYKSLNQFRLSLDQIKAIFHLLHFCDEQFNMEHRLRHIHKMFEYTDPLWDDHVTAILAKSYNLSGDMTEYQIRNLDSQFQTLKNCYRTNGSDLSNAKQKGSKHLMNIEMKDLKMFSESLFMLIRKDISSTSDLKDLHLIRKNMKEYLFITSLGKDKKAFQVKKEDLAFFEMTSDLINKKIDLEKLFKKTGRLSHIQIPERTANKIKKDILQINLEIEDSFIGWNKKTEYGSKSYTEI